MSYSHLSNVEHTVYRLYDQQDRLIYVGCTYDLEKRLQAHRRKMWWFYQISRISTETHPNRSEALKSETRIRDTEAPRWNVESRWMMRHSFTKEMFQDYMTALDRHPSKKYGSIAKRLEKARAEYEQRYGNNQQQAA